MKRNNEGYGRVNSIITWQAQVASSDDNRKDPLDKTDR